VATCERYLLYSMAYTGFETGLSIFCLVVMVDLEGQSPGSDDGGGLNRVKAKVFGVVI